MDMYPVHVYKSSVCGSCILYTPTNLVYADSCILYTSTKIRSLADSLPVVSPKKKRAVVSQKKRKEHIYIYIYLRLFSSCMASKYIYMLFSFFFATQQLFSFFPPVGTSSSPSDLQSKARQSKDLQSKARPTFHHTPLSPAGL